MARERITETLITRKDNDTGDIKTFTERRTSKTETDISHGSLVAVFGVVLLMLCVLFTLLGKDTPTIGWLLETLQTAPKMDMTWVQTIFNTNLPDWADFILKPLQAIMFIGSAIVQVLVFIIHFLGALFF